MGYRGKLEEQERARTMRADGMTLLDIATQLGVSKSSVSLWVRDVEFTPSPRRYGAQRRPHPFHEAKLRQIAAMNVAGVERIGVPRRWSLPRRRGRPLRRGRAQRPKDR